MQEDNELVERWVRRGGKAVVLQRGPLGEMMVIREGRRTMPIAWVHQLPATFEGRARMMVANALAAAAAAHAAGAHLHDIRQGLRSFTHLDLPGARPAEPVRPERGQGPHRLRAQRRRAWRRVGDFVERMTSSAPRPAPPGRRSWSANLRVAVVATPGRPPGRGHARAGPRRGEVLRRGHHPRGPEPPRPQARARRPSTIMEGSSEATATGRARRQRRDRPRRDGRHPHARSTGPARATSSCCASTTPPRCGRSWSGDGPSPTRGSCRPARATARSRPPAATPTW